MYCYFCDTKCLYHHNLHLNILNLNHKQTYFLVLLMCSHLT